MSHDKGTSARGGRRVHVPEECAGLTAAIDAALRGDDRALSDWLRRDAPKLELALRRAGFDAALAEDTVVLLEEETLRARRIGRAIASELAWAATVARTAWSRRRRELARAEALDWEPPAGTAESPADAFERQDVFARLRTAVSSLPEEHRDAIQLRYIDGLPMRHVVAWFTKHHGVRRRRVHQVLDEALARLRACLDRPMQDVLLRGRRKLIRDSAAHSAASRLMNSRRRASPRTAAPTRLPGRPAPAAQTAGGANMILGVTILKMNGEAYVGPPIQRQTTNGNFVVQVTNVIGAPTLTVIVQHRNRDDTGWGTAGTFSSITANGTYALGVTGLKELVRFQFQIAAATAGAGMHVFTPAPNWLIDY